MIVVATEFAKRSRCRQFNFTFSASLGAFKGRWLLISNIQGVTNCLHRAKSVLNPSFPDDIPKKHIIRVWKFLSGWPRLNVLDSTPSSRSVSISGTTENSHQLPEETSYIIEPKRAISNLTEMQFSDTKLAMSSSFETTTDSVKSHIWREKFSSSKKISCRDVSDQHPPLVYSTDDVCSFLEPS